VEFDGGNEFLHSSVLTGFSSHVFVGTLLVALAPLGPVTTVRAVILAEPSLAKVEFFATVSQDIR
jgi:hypothetical protein